MGKSARRARSETESRDKLPVNDRGDNNDIKELPLRSSMDSVVRKGLVVKDPVTGAQVPRSCRKARDLSGGGSLPRIRNTTLSGKRLTKGSVAMTHARCRPLDRPVSREEKFCG